MVFSNDDKIREIFFISSGSAAYVLPPFRNTRYINIKKGDSFGMVDIVGSCEIDETTKEFSDPEIWYRVKHRLFRQFAVMATDTLEV